MNKRPFGDRSTGRTSHHERAFTAATGQRRITRFGSGATIAVARFCEQRSHRPRTDARPPGRPRHGLGSHERYIATEATEYAVGSATNGERVWWYVPDVLLHGKKAPVIIYLHGFRAAIPDLYSEHIHHLTRQGFIVIFPRYNKASLRGMATDNDQNAMFRRTIASVRGALAELGPAADGDAVYLFGHSLGGLFAACWPALGCVTARGIVVAHPSLSLERIPAWARQHITPLDYEPLLAKVEVPVWLLNGDADTIAPTDESKRLFELLTHAPEKRLFVAKSDGHGAPRLVPGHLATVRDDSHMLHLVLETFGGGTGSDDALHSRYYYAALDAMVHGLVPHFDMGEWSDGTPVAGVEQLMSQLRGAQLSA